MLELILKKLTGNKKAVLVFFLCAGFALYANTLRNPFVFDDIVVISENNALKEASNPLEAFKYDVFGEKVSVDTGFYRPVASLSFFFDYAVGKLNPFIYHFDNILIHILNSFLLFILLRKLGLGEEAALLAAFIYLIHPANTTAVAYVSARDSLLGVFFGFLCFIAWESAPLLSVPLFMFSALCKENMVVLPFIIFFYWLFFELKTAPWKSKKGLTLFSLMLLSLLYTGLRVYMQKNSALVPLSFLSAESFTVRTLTFIKALYVYLGIVLFPVKLAFENHFIERQVLNVYNALTVLTGLALAYVYRKNYARFKFYAFYLLWFLIGLATVSNIFLPLSATIRLQWLYLPLGALLAVLADALLRAARGPAGKKYVKAALLVWLPFLCVQTVRRNALWSDPLKFFKYETRVEPKNFLAWCALGDLYYDDGNYLMAEYCFNESVQQSPGKSYDLAISNLAEARKKINEVKK